MGRNIDTQVDYDTDSSDPLCSNLWKLQYQAEHSKICQFKFKGGSRG